MLICLLHSLVLQYVVTARHAGVIDVLSESEVSAHIYSRVNEYKNGLMTPPFDSHSRCKYLLRALSIYIFVITFTMYIGTCIFNPNLDYVKTIFVELLTYFFCRA